MFCPSCGAEVEATHRFCHQCAAPLAGARPAATSSPSVNIVPLPGVADVPVTRSLAPSLDAPLPVPTLAPPPTFQAVPGGAPQPAAVVPARTEPLPVVDAPSEPVPSAPVPVVPVQSVPVPVVPAAVSPIPTVQPVEGMGRDDTPGFVALDSKGEPVPPPPLSVGAPMASAASATTAVLPVEPAGATDWEAATAEQPAVSTRSGSTEVLPRVDEHHFRLTGLLVLAVLTAVVAVSAAVLDIVSFLVTGTDSAARTVLLDDLSSNHLIGVIVGVVLLLVGAIVGATGRRFGSGLACGAALGLAGLLVNAVGLGVEFLDDVEVAYLATPGNTITSTREIGFFLAIGGAGLAILACCAALAAARGGGRPRLVLTLLGIVATAAAVVGPLIPVGGAEWLDNWSQADVPDATMWLRLAALALLLVAGVTAFSIGGRFGGAMALGAVSIAVVQTATAYLDLGARPLGLANGNFFAADGGVEIEPHLVTIAGVLAVVLLGVVTVMVPARRRRG